MLANPHRTHISGQVDGGTTRNHLAHTEALAPNTISPTLRNPGDRCMTAAASHRHPPESVATQAELCGPPPGPRLFALTRRPCSEKRACLHVAKTSTIGLLGTPRVVQSTRNLPLQGAVQKGSGRQTRSPIERTPRILVNTKQELGFG